MKRKKSKYKLNKDGKQIRGFLAMTPEQRSEIARKGGKTVSKDRKYMAKIGRSGGKRGKRKAKKA